jgi:hypothetical protein
MFAFALPGCGPHTPEKASNLAKQQVEVVGRGNSVMPFDINRTMHHFQKLPSGGVQQVVSTYGDPDQIALIREHLKDEAGRFQHGDFSDPSNIHGPQMPGLKTLAAGASRIGIRYTEIQRGAQITYATADPKLVTAIHAWFDTQVREHGRHAMPM